jgi:RHS repeat-associated protein
MNISDVNFLNSQTGSSTGKLGFQSKYYDSESGLNYYYHRYYYPGIGRFVNEDPIGISGGTNLYQFTNNNPITWKDIIGLDITKNGIEEWIRDADEAIRTADEALRKLKRLREMDERHRRQEEMKYCPSWVDCYKNCVYAGLFSGVKSWTVFLWSVNIDIVRYTATAIKIASAAKVLSQSLTLGGAIGSAAISAYCAAHCLINSKVY